MMHCHFRSGLRITIAAASALLAACAHSGDTVFYTLDPHPPAQAPIAAYRGPTIQVDAVRLPASLDRPELIRRTGPGTMQVDDFARWAAPLGDLAQRVVTQDLAARLAADAVIYPGAPKPAGARSLSIDVLNFEVENGAGIMDVSWELDPAGPSGQPPLPPIRRTLHLDVAEPDTGSKGSADALSRIFAALADDVVAQAAAR